MDEFDWLFLFMVLSMIGNVVFLGLLTRAYKHWSFYQAEAFYYENKYVEWVERAQDLAKQLQKAKDAENRCIVDMSVNDGKPVYLEGEAIDATLAKIEENEGSTLPHPAQSG